MPNKLWYQRHHAILFILWLHVLAIVGYALFLGKTADHAIIDVLPIIVAAILAGIRIGPRQLQAAIASLGLVACSAVLVHLSGGVTEMHFHFFISLAIVAFYQDWIPMAVAFLFVVIEHGVVGVMSPMSVYNHPDAWNNPWTWALIHGGFVGAASICNILAWRLSEYNSLHDALKGLPNRMLFRYRVEHAVRRSERESSSVVVLYLDLDNFKQVNDIMGHAAGDELLMQVTRKFRECLRQQDMLARLGGDEFAILLDGPCDMQQVSDIAERLTMVLTGMQVRASVKVGVSIGLAWSQAGQTSVDDLIRNADVAMYVAKRNGNGQHRMFDPAMRDELVQRIEFETLLGLAIERDELFIQYQPVFNIHTSELAGMEALVRWRHPQLGVIPPDKFIPMAEENGQIILIGKWVLDEACRRGAAWINQYDTQLTMSVNLSGRQIAQPNIVQVVADAIAHSGFPAHQLILEITETALLTDIEGSVAKLTELRKLGIRLAIDDFGTGYSSLSYLQRLPVDILKIDKSFVSGGGSAALAATIVEMSRKLNLETVAEGIEDRNQLEYLRSINCNLGQGYFMAKPLDVDGLETLLRLHYLAKQKLLLIG